MQSHRCGGCQKPVGPRRFAGHYDHPYRLQKQCLGYRRLRRRGTRGYLRGNPSRIAKRNISAGFDLATRLTGAKNLVEAIEMQAAYWHNQFGELRMQAEEVRALLERVTDSVAEPIKAQVTQDRMRR
jgi:hypothetical protein